MGMHDYYWPSTFIEFLEGNRIKYETLDRTILKFDEDLEVLRKTLSELGRGMRRPDPPTEEEVEENITTLKNINADLGNFSSSLNFVRGSLTELWRNGQDMEGPAKEADAAHIVAQKANNNADAAFELAHAGEEEAAEARREANRLAWQGRPSFISANASQVAQLKKAMYGSPKKSGRSTRRSRRRKQ